MAKYLLVVGAQKAATTSIFSYLAAHPEVAACKVKEPHFFLPPDYPVRKHFRYGVDSVSRYLDLFPADSQKLRVEGSATYFHEPGTAEKIADVLGESKIVISLRDPIDRLVSWYSMAKLRQWIPHDQSFADYVAAMASDPAPMCDRKHHYRALQHGLYAEALEEYFSVFGRERVFLHKVVKGSYDNLAVMRAIARFSGISTSFYDDFDFKREYSARAFKAPILGPIYEYLKPVAKKILGISEERSSLAVWARKVVSKVLMKPAERPVMDEATHEFLRNFYADDVHRSGVLLGEALPWAGRY